MRVAVKLGNIEQALQIVEDYQKRWAEAADKLALRYAEEAAEAIDKAYGGTHVSGDKDYAVTIEIVDDGKYQVKASGESVPFLEWGAGVTYNPDPVPRPEWVLGIGEYGKKQGRNERWRMPGGHWSYGNPAAQGFVLAREAVVTRAVDIAREVLG